MISNPVIYAIYHNKKQCVCAMRVDNHYAFNLGFAWKLIPTDPVESAIHTIDKSAIERIQNDFKSATKGAIELLTVCYSTFRKVNPDLTDIANDLPSCETIISHSVDTNFIALNLSDIRSRYQMNKMPWLQIYVDKILKAHALPTQLASWGIVNVPHNIIWPNSKVIDSSKKLINLHHAIKQLNITKAEVSKDIADVSESLDRLIVDTSMVLPDICLHMIYKNTETPAFEGLFEKGMLLIMQHAELGIACGNMNLSNIAILESGDIIVKHYNKAILSPKHDAYFDISVAQKLLSSILHNSNIVISNEDQAFNALVMYDMVIFILSIKKIFNKDSSAMRQVSNSIRSKISTISIGGNATYQDTYESSFGKYQSIYHQWKPTCSNDADKYSYLRNYLFEFLLQ